MFGKRFERFMEKVECRLHQMGYDAWSNSDIFPPKESLAGVDFYFRCDGRYEVDIQGMTDDMRFSIRNRNGMYRWSYDITKFDIEDELTLEYVCENFIRLHLGVAA